ncbi:ABC transporter substrate-binding protein [Sporolactobacillus sp. Y61]|uniref:ABC transporter substrate-binding protein n=1 Tax=Sporolactobacillus sp. Y61 TaxID=3160863 RepID=A0AAU8II82_9BACL
MKKNMMLVISSIAVMCLFLTACTGNGATGSSNGNSGITTLKLGYAKCAHCLPMSLTPQYQDKSKVNIQATSFQSGNDVLTALTSKSIDVAQVTYLHFITALDRGLDIVAISGQVNGGSDIIASNKLNLKADDWASLKTLVKQRKADGKPLKIAASRGNAQDIHLRGELQLHGINPNKDIEFVNIANPADHEAALERNEVDLICTVEPSASKIILDKKGKHFAYPYNQAAGNLTNIIVTRSDVIKDHPEAVKAFVEANMKVVDKISADKAPWISVIQKNTGMSSEVSTRALDNAYPDYKMYKSKTLAIAKMMKELKYINTDVSKKVEKQMDYTILESITGKNASELGDN